jgi:hypothetical protein
MAELFKAKLRVILMADETVVADIEDPFLWARILGDVEGRTAPQDLPIRLLEDAPIRRRRGRPPKQQAAPKVLLTSEERSEAQKRAWERRRTALNAAAALKAARAADTGAS